MWPRAPRWVLALTALFGLQQWLSVSLAEAAPLVALPSHPAGARCGVAPASTLSGPPKLAVGFFGLVYRNLAATIPTLERHVFAPLDRAPLVYDVLLHTLLVLSEPLGGTGLKDPPAWLVARNGSGSVRLDPFSLVLLRPCIFEVEDQGLARADIAARRAKLARDIPDFWHDNYRSVNNYLVALHSLARLGALIRGREGVLGGQYDVVLVLRADTRFLCDVDLPLRLPALLKANSMAARASRRARPTKRARGVRGHLSPPSASNGIVVVPPWGRWGGTNDRFAYGCRTAMLETYLGRGQAAWELLAAGKHQRNGEHLLRSVLRRAGVEIRHTSVVVQRFRPLGLGKDDWVGMADDAVEYLRDDLSHTFTPNKKHWISEAGKHSRNTTREELCALSRLAVSSRGTWGPSRWASNASAVWQAGRQSRLSGEEGN